MLRKLEVNGITWIDGIGLSNKEIIDVLMDYEDIHELDLEACLEDNQKARIDDYDNYSFVIYHFPKYDKKTKSYSLNEFNIFLWKDTIITFRNFSGIHIDKIFNNYEGLMEGTDDFKNVTSGYILYEITQVMLEKMFKLTRNVRIDLKNIEKHVFEGSNESLVKDIMIKKRNIVVLRHMFKPQIVVFKKLETTINELYKGEIEEYFEDLEDKLEQVVNDVQILWEYIDNIEDAFKSILNIKTNFVMKILTLFSAFLLPLTLITSFYGMNIDLPYQNNPHFVYILILESIAFMIILYLYFKISKKM